jgi:hypothetical protein
MAPRQSGSRAPAEPPPPPPPRPQVSAEVQRVIDRVLEATAVGQRNLFAKTASGLERIETGVATEEKKIDARATDASRQFGESVASARTVLTTAIESAHQQLSDGETTAHAKLEKDFGELNQEAQQTFEDAGKKMKKLGRDKGKVAAGEGETAAQSARGQTEGMARQATERGEAKALIATSPAPKAIPLKQKAATDIAGNTAKEITKSLTNVMKQLRDAGIKTQGHFEAESDDMAGRLERQLIGVTDHIDALHSRTEESLTSAYFKGRSNLDRLAGSLVKGLTRFEAGVRTQLQHTAQESKQAVRASGETSIREIRQQESAVAGAGGQLVDVILQSVGNRRIRRAAAERLAGRLGDELVSGYGRTGDQALAAMAEVAMTFAVAAGAAHEALLRQVDEATVGVSHTSAEARRQLQKQLETVIAGGLTMVEGAVADGRDLTKSASSRLDEAIKDVGGRFDKSVATLRDTLTGKVGEAVANARKPLGDLDQRIDEGMHRAGRRIEDGWLTSQWHDIAESVNWGFVLGLIVGLLVTLVAVIVFGPGLLTLVVAGAIAGALSVLASTLLENYRHEQKTDWAELGKAMLWGAALGAVTGLVGGGLGGTLGNTARAVVATEIASNITGIAGGAIQNYFHDQPWDQGLLLNIGLGAAMGGFMHLGPVKSRMQTINDAARAAAIDRKIAFNVGTNERAAITARQQAAAEARAKGGKAAPADTATAVPGETDRAAPPSGGPADNVPGAFPSKGGGPSSRMGHVGEPVSIVETKALFDAGLVWEEVRPIRDWDIYVDEYWRASGRVGEQPPLPAFVGADGRVVAARHGDGFRSAPEPLPPGLADRYQRGEVSGGPGRSGEGHPKPEVAEPHPEVLPAEDLGREVSVEEAQRLNDDDRATHFIPESDWDAYVVRYWQETGKVGQVPPVPGFVGRGGKRFAVREYAKNWVTEPRPIREGLEGRFRARQAAGPERVPASAANSREIDKAWTRENIQSGRMQFVDNWETYCKAYWEATGRVGEQPPVPGFKVGAGEQLVAFTEPTPEDKHRLATRARPVPAGLAESFRPGTAPSPGDVTMHAPPPEAPVVVGGAEPASESAMLPTGEQPVVSAPTAGDSTAQHRTDGPTGANAPQPLRANLSDTDLGALGMPPKAAAKFKEFAEGYGLIVDVRPTNPEARARLESGEALPKPEVLKQKTINDLDVLLGVDPKHKGLVGHLDPAQLAVPAEGSVVRHPVSGEPVTVDKPLHQQLSDRWAKRAREFDPNGPIGRKMKALIEGGGFSIEPPGIIKFGEGAEARPFTGDHDVFDIRRADGRPLTPEEYRFLVQQMREWGMNVEHGAHLHWITDDPAKLDIARQHGPGSDEPLIRFGDGAVKEAVWDGDLHAQDKLAPSSDVITPGGEFARHGGRSKPEAE